MTREYPFNCYFIGPFAPFSLAKHQSYTCIEVTLSLIVARDPKDGMNHAELWNLPFSTIHGYTPTTGSTYTWNPYGFLRKIHCFVLVLKHPVFLINRCSLLTPRQSESFPTSATISVEKLTEKETDQENLGYPTFGT